MVKEFGITSPATEAYGSLSREEKRSLIGRKNIGVTASEIDDVTTQSVFAAAQELGFIPIQMDSIFYALSLVLDGEGVSLPVGAKAKQERGTMVANALSSLEIKKELDNFQISLPRNDGTEEIIQFPEQPSVDTLTQLDMLKSDPMVFGKALGFLKKFLRDNVGLIVDQATPQQFITDGVRIAVGKNPDDVRADTRRKADKTVIRGDNSGVKFGLLRELAFSDVLSTQREALENAIDRREIHLTPRFEMNNWPKDPLMSRLRQIVTIRSSQFVAEHDIMCDPQDLKYQALFRLTTFPIDRIFIHGDKLESYLRLNGNYQNWRNILTTDADLVNRYEVNEDLLNQILLEQNSIIQNRLSKSGLPLDEILTPDGIFAEPGWVIQKRNGKIFAIKEEGAMSLSDKIPLKFEEIDPQIASQIHNDLHYIHTPRVDRAFGLFLEGQDFPFSALAFEKIDREYKQNVLILHGYDPRKCYDLTRLYSRPGTPGNTSSSIFSLAFNYLKSNNPDIQAIMSSFMPSYATGVSMTSGGFDNPVLIKPLSHTFAQQQIEGETVYENLTRRRLEKSDGKIVSSLVPLLPTVELVSALQEPRFPPTKRIRDFMVELTKL